MSYKGTVYILGIFALTGYVMAFSEMEKQAYRQDLSKIQAKRELLNPRLDKEAFQKDPDSYMKKIRAFRDNNDLNVYEEFAAGILNKWVSKNAEHYGRLALELCEPLSSGNFKDMRQVELARKYALSALEKSNEIPLELELELTGHVTTLTIIPEAPKGQNFALSRKKDMEVRLHAWQRLLNAIDPSWNAQDMPQLNVAPPNGVNGISGMDPDAIEDPILRAEYEAAIEANSRKAKKYNEQYGLRDWLKRYPKYTETYMTCLYSAPPYNNEELVRFLNDFKFDDAVKTRIINTVTENINKQTNFREN